MDNHDVNPSPAIQKFSRGLGKSRTAHVSKSLRPNRASFYPACVVTLFTIWFDILVTCACSLISPEYQHNQSSSIEITHLFRNIHTITYTEMAKHSVLISGGGIAGSVLAYWLGKSGFHVVVLERSSGKGTAGQIIDVEGPAEEVVRRMGLIEEVRARSTHEAGYRMMDATNNVIGTLPAGNSSASKEIEIMRPELADILYTAASAQEEVEFRFNSSVHSITNTPEKVIVEIENSATDQTITESFDMLVACDGLRSKTRNMILSPEECENCIKTINTFIAFFSIPAEPQDKPYARSCQFPGRKLVFIKPETEKRSSAYLGTVKNVEALREARRSRDVTKQKTAIKEYFQGSGWETDRILEGMMDTDNFYFEEISQVYLNRWHQGRCVLLGDTAYCPSPLTGQGTPLAMIGAYVLASKIIATPDNPPKAFEEYDKDFRPFVNKKQPIPLGGLAPKFLNPDTALGIWILRTIFAWVTWLAPWRFLPEFGSESYKLPDL